MRAIRTLLVDGNRIFLGAAAEFLSGYPRIQLLERASSGAQALEMIRRLKPHVATLDIRMPEVNGIKVLETLRKEKQEIEIIVLTGLEETEYRKKCLSLGAKYFLHKATEFETVIEVLKDYAVKLNRPTV